MSYRCDPITLTIRKQNSINFKKFGTLFSIFTIFLPANQSDVYLLAIVHMEVYTLELSNIFPSENYVKLTGVFSVPFMA